MLHYRTSHVFAIILESTVDDGGGVGNGASTLKNGSCVVVDVIEDIGVGDGAGSAFVVSSSFLSGSTDL